MTAKSPLKSTHHSEFGAANWPNGIDGGGVCLRRRLIRLHVVDAAVRRCAESGSKPSPSSHPND
jgi:hypothetical protein